MLHQTHGQDVLLRSRLLQHFVLAPFLGFVLRVTLEGSAQVACMLQGVWWDVQARKIKTTGH